MGLDWVLDKSKAKPGFEERYQTVTKMLQDMRVDGAVSKDLEEELEEISISVYEVVGAPQVGHDERANEWFRKNCYEPALEDLKKGRLSADQEAFWARPYDEILEEHKGKYVMELARDQGGEAPVSGIAVQSVDFRGKVLRFIEGISPELVDESYEDHTAEECLDYASRLEEELPNVPDGREGKELLQAAIKWLRFWGEKGFGYWAWY